MLIPSPPSTPEADPPTARGLKAWKAKRRGSLRAIAILDNIIFAFLCLLAILLPQSIKGAQHSWQLAFLFWLVKLAVDRERPLPQPLSAPLLAYIVFSGLSTALSPDPNLSWDRMKIACLLLVGIVVAQNVHRLTQVRTLIYLLVLSGLAAAAFTGWQYTYGVGVRVSYILPVAPLYQAHLHHDDIITRVNGFAVHTPTELERIFQQSPAGSLFRIDYVRGFPFHKKQTFVTREQVMQSGFGSQWLQFARGRPFKAQGTLGHYVVLAEMMMQIGCMAWAMLLSVDRRRRGLQALFAVTFVALTATLFLTETRAALAGLAAGCFVALVMLAGKRTRTWATIALIVLVLASVVWIRHTRGPQGLGGTNDPGTHFRTMMWEDGLRLIGEHPLFGVGMETIRNHWAAWNIRAFTYFHDESHFHNDMIQIGVERGLPALAAWVWFVIAYVLLLFRLIRQWRERNRFAAGAAAGLLGSFVAYQTTALVHYDLGIESVAMILFFYFGLAIALERMLHDSAAVDMP
jgi:O-antigen ligase